MSKYTRSGVSLWWSTSQQYKGLNYWSLHQHGRISRTLFRVKEARSKHSIYCMIPFDWRSRKAKLNYGDRRTDHWLPEAVGMRRLTTKEHEEPFWVDRNVDMLLVIRVHICQSSSNCTLKTAVLAEYKLYLKVDF